MPNEFIQKNMVVFGFARELLFPGDFVTSAYMPQQCFSDICQMAAPARLRLNRHRAA